MIPDPNASNNMSTSSIPSANMVSSSITPSAMQNAIDYAKQDPTSSYAQELQKRIQAGSYNGVLSLMGKDTSKYGQQAAPAAPVPAPVTPNPVAETASDYMDNVAPAAADVQGGGNIGAASDEFQKGNIPMGVEDATLGVGSDAVKAIFAPIAAPLQTLIAHASASSSSNPSITADTVDSPAAQQARQQISDWAAAHPDISKTLGDIFNVGTSIAGSGALDTSVGDAATAVKNGVTNTVASANDAAGAVKTAIVGTPEEQAAAQAVKTGAQATKDAASTVSALDPELKGAKLVAAQREAITGTRTIRPATMFTEQTLSPGARTISLGQRLSSDIPLSEGDTMPKVVLSKDPVKNTAILRQALTDTENKLTTALKGDPDINFNADKPTLYEALDSAQKTSPEEFRIGENKIVTKNVFNFANKVIAKSDDSIEGLRDARTALDSQARVEYPNAFNPDGSVNVRSAAGSAIKRARDIINQHLYNTAPAGSDIQKLIAREADIFQASTPVATKAAAGVGKTIPERVIGNVRKHPVISTAVAASAGVAAAKGLGI